MRITGSATIRIDGEEIRSLGDATLNPGGFNRETKDDGGKVVGYSESVVGPSIECKVAHTKEGRSLVSLAGIRNATVIFETDTGTQFILRNAWVSEPPTLTAKGGEVSLKIAAMAMDEA